MKERNGEHPLGDAGQLVLLGLFLVVWVVDSFFLHISTFLVDYLPLYVRLDVLALAFVISVYLVRSGHVVISHEHRPTSVVSTGAFRYVRHPLYLASILFYIGLTVTTASLFCFTLLIVAFAFYNYIAGYEEKLLVQKFGEDYQSYKKRTGKWLPKVGRRD